MRPRFRCDRARIAAPLQIASGAAESNGAVKGQQVIVIIPRDHVRIVLSEIVMQLCADQERMMPFR